MHLNAVKVLGLTIPLSLLALADEVMERESLKRWLVLSCLTAWQIVTARSGSLRKLDDEPDQGVARGVRPFFGRRHELSGLA